MNKLKVLSKFMPLKDGEQLNRKVKTVDNIPKMLTIIAEAHRAREDFGGMGKVNEAEGY